MLVDGKPHRTIWPDEAGVAVEIIDQTRLPHEFVTARLETPEDAAHAIRAMLVRGAPLIGATAAYGMALAMHQDSSDAALDAAATLLLAARPTAVDLRWAVDDLSETLQPAAPGDRFRSAWARAAAIADESAETCRRIGEHGTALIEAAWQGAAKEARPVNVLTHCNAGWLATVDWGTATAPIYAAHDAGIPVHVWVDETRPRNQGAALTCWELANHGVPHTLIVDNAGGHLMQHGKVDLCITGTDRTAANGDVCNKIGTYLKALAAHDNEVPFYVGLPHSTIDWTLDDGFKIQIEERDGAEVTDVQGRTPDGTVTIVRISPDASPAANPAFDVTPARLVTGLVTERGVCPASTEGLLSLYPERRPNRPG